VPAAGGARLDAARIRPGDGGHDQGPGIRPGLRAGRRPATAEPGTVAARYGQQARLRRAIRLRSAIGYVTIRVGEQARLRESTPGYGRDRVTGRKTGPQPGYGAAPLRGPRTGTSTGRAARLRPAERDVGSGAADDHETRYGAGRSRSPGWAMRTSEAAKRRIARLPIAGERSTPPPARAWPGFAGPQGLAGSAVLTVSSATAMGHRGVPPVPVEKSRPVRGGWDPVRSRDKRQAGTATKPVRAPTQPRKRAAGPSVSRTPPARTSATRGFGSGRVTRAGWTGSARWVASADEPGRPGLPAEVYPPAGRRTLRLPQHASRCRRIGHRTALRARKPTPQNGYARNGYGADPATSRRLTSSPGNDQSGLARMVTSMTGSARTP